MLITSAEVLVASPGRNFVTLRITTADGVTGLGDGTVNGRELSVASYLTDHVVPLLIGRDAHQIEDTWQYLYRGAYWRRGPITMAAIAAVDTALWDIKAKAANLPLYQLLGGRSRSGCLVYGHASGKDLPQLFDSVRDHLAQGYRAIRIQTGIPGLDSVYGVAASSTPVRVPDPRATTTNRPGGPPPRSRSSGTPGPTCATYRPSSRRSATSSAPSCRCCTTPITGSPRSRRPSSGRPSNRTTCSGSKT